MRVVASSNKLSINCNGLDRKLGASNDLVKSIMIFKRGLGFANVAFQVWYGQSFGYFHDIVAHCMTAAFIAMIIICYGIWSPKDRVICMMGAYFLMLSLRH